MQRMPLAGDAVNTVRMSRAESEQIRTCALLENAADCCYARHDSDDSRTQKWSTLAHFAGTVAYDLRRIAPAVVELCESAASEYACDLQDYAGDVDAIEWWTFERRAMLLADDISIAFARHHGGNRDGQRVCECAECDALEAARDLAGWIGRSMPRRVDHWSWDTYAGLLASRDSDAMAEEWWRGQMLLAGAPVACCEEWLEDRQAA